MAQIAQMAQIVCVWLISNPPVSPVSLLSSLIDPAPSSAQLTQPQGEIRAVSPRSRVCKSSRSPQVFQVPRFTNAAIRAVNGPSCPYRVVKGL